MTWMPDILYGTQDRRCGGWTTTRTNRRRRPRSRPKRTSLRGWSGSATSATWLESPEPGSTSPSPTRDVPRGQPGMRGPIPAFFLGTTKRATWEEISSRLCERGFVWLWIDEDRAVEPYLRRGDVIEWVRGGVRTLWRGHRAYR